MNIFSSVSMTGTGVAIYALMTVLAYFGVSLSEGDVAKVVEQALSVFSFVLMVYGQLRRKDLNYGVFRK